MGTLLSGRRFLALIPARMGQAGTTVHVFVFAFLFLAFLVRAMVRVMSHLPDATPQASALGPCLAVLTECVPVFKVHAHLIGFPAFLRLLRLPPEAAWLAGPLTVAVFYPLFWIWLTARRGVPMILASILVLGIFNLPVLSGMSESPNGDVLTNILVITLLILILEYPRNIVIVMMIALAALLTHQRVLLIIPFFVLLSVSQQGSKTLFPVRPALESWIRALLALFLAVAAFFLFKEIFYSKLWNDHNIYNKLDLMSQIYRILGLKGDASVPGSIQEGSVFRYLFHSDNWRIWGLLYFTPFLGAFLYWRRRDPIRVLTYLAVWGGTVIQLLMAEDVHRLTSFFFLGIVLLAVDAQAMEKRARLMVGGFLALGYAWVFLPNILRLN